MLNNTPYPFLDLADSLHKEAGVISGISNWTGENVIGPIAAGVSKFTNLPEKLEAARQRTVQEATPVVAERVAEKSTEGVGNWLKEKTDSLKEGWENIYGKGINALGERLPEGMQPVTNWMGQHPYLTPALAMLIPALATLMYRRVAGNRDREEAPRVQVINTPRSLDKFL